MTTPATHPAGTNGRTRAADWFGLLGGALAWLAHLLGAYLISEFGCIAGLGHVTFLQVTAVAWLLTALSAVVAAAAVAAVLVARYRRRQWTARPSDQAEGAIVYMNRLGCIAGLLFVLIILAQSIPIIFYLGRC